MKYMTPEVEVEMYSAVDVIRTSAPETEWHTMPQPGGGGGNG